MSPYHLLSTRLQTLAAEAAADGQRPEAKKITLEEAAKKADLRLIELANIRIYLSQTEAEQAK